jgi:3-phenylpropionate/trans-cinnamate dioxygenase ferredoxin reductase subunit
MNGVVIGTMTKHHVKYLLVGGGVASSAAAQAIRERDREGEVLLITQESTRPYHRPPLSKEGLRNRQPRAAFFAQPPGWFEAHGVELRTGRRASHLDTSRQAVTLDDGNEISFDHLLLATGALPRHLTIPGYELPSLHYLRTFDDLERLQHAIDQAKAEGRAHTRTGGGASTGRGRVAVIGSGLLGVELAASLAQMGLEVDLLVKGEHLWSRFAGETTAKWASRFLEQHSVMVHPHGAPLRLEGDGRVQRVILPDQSVLPCDFAIAAVGAIASKELLRGTPIAAEKAILTDEYCQTSVPNIYAAGDCAALFDPLFGKHRLLDHFDSAKTVGALAGRNMTGAREAYADVSHFWSELFDVTLHAWGDSRHVHHRLVRGNPSPESPDFIEFGLAADNRISQVVAVNHAGDHETLKQLVKNRTSITDREELLKDPASDLAQLLS